MKLGYAHRTEKKEFSARATGKEMRIKFKHAKEICAAIQGMKASDAVAYLEKVSKKKALVPFKKTTRQGGHKKGLRGWPFGRTPVKAVRAILPVLKSAVANAEFKGLEADQCKVVSAIALRGRKMFRLKPRGRYAVYRTHLTSVQIVIEEISE